MLLSIPDGVLQGSFGIVDTDVLVVNRDIFKLPVTVFIVAVRRLMCIRSSGPYATFESFGVVNAGREGDKGEVNKYKKMNAEERQIWRKSTTVPLAHTPLCMLRFLT